MPLISPLMPVPNMLVSSSIYSVRLSNTYKTTSLFYARLNVVNVVKWRHSIVVRMLVLAGELSLSCARLLDG